MVRGMNMVNTVRDILDIVLRSVISVVVLFILARVMGKKQISQLSFFDYIVGISIGSISAAFAVDNTIPYFHALIALVIYGIFPVAVSYISLRSVRSRKLLGGKPTILIQNGKLIEKNLKKSRFHVNDVLEELRLKGAFSLNDVEFAILETSGKVSVQLKAPFKPVTCEDLKLQTAYMGLSADLIIDGEVIEENLKLVNHDKNWLSGELKKQMVDSPEDVLLATVDSKDKLHIDLKNHDPEPYDVIE